MIERRPGLPSPDGHRAASVNLIDPPMRLNVSWKDIAPRQLPAVFEPTDPADPAYDWRPSDLSVLLAVENAPPGKRAWYGMFPQLGAPVGFICSGGIFLLLSAWLTD